MRQTNAPYPIRPEPFSPQLSVVATISLAVLCWLGIIGFVNLMIQL